MNLLDKIGKGAAVGIGVLAGFMPQQYAHGQSEYDYSIRENLRKGNVDTAKFLMQTQQDIAVFNEKLRREKEIAEQKATERQTEAQRRQEQEKTREEAGRQVREETKLTTTELERLDKQNNLADFYICNTGEDGENRLLGSKIRISKDNTKTIKFGHLPTIKSPYKLAIFIKDESGKVVETIVKDYKTPAILGDEISFSLNNLPNGAYRTEFILTSNTDTTIHNKTLIIE